MLLNKGSLKNVQDNACYNQRKPFSFFSWLLNCFRCTRRNKTAVNYSVDRYSRDKAGTGTPYILPVGTGITLGPWQAALTWDKARAFETC